MENAGKKTRRFGVGMRVLAGVLALMMLFSAAVLLLTRIVRPESGGTLTEKAVREAFAALGENDAYLNASAATRVGMFLSRLGSRPESAADYEQLASVYAGRGDYAEAAVLYENSVDKTDRADAAALANRYLKLASARVLNGELISAAEGYRQSLLYDPTSLYARLLLAQVCIETQSYDEAAIQLLYYLTLVPGDADNRRLLGNLYEVQGRYAEAHEAYDRVYRATNAAEDCLSAARTAALCGDDAEGIALYTAYFESAEDADGSGHYLRGIAYLRSGDCEAAKADLLDAIERGFSDAAACYVSLTICTYTLGDYEATIDYGERAAALLNASDGECLQRMGLSALQLARYPEAEDYLARSLAASPTLIENHFFLANVYLLEAEYEKARASFGLAIENGYLLQQCYYNRAVCSLQLGDYDAAKDDLKRCIGEGDDAAIIASARDFLAQLRVPAAEIP